MLRKRKDQIKVETIIDQIDLMIKKMIVREEKTLVEVNIKVKDQRIEITLNKSQEIVNQTIKEETTETISQEKKDKIKIQDHHNLVTRLIDQETIILGAKKRKMAYLRLKENSEKVKKNHLTTKENIDRKEQCGSLINYRVTA